MHSKFAYLHVFSSRDITERRSPPSFYYVVDFIDYHLSEVDNGGFFWVDGFRVTFLANGVHGLGKCLAPHTPLFSAR